MDAEDVIIGSIEHKRLIIQESCGSRMEDKLSDFQVGMTRMGTFRQILNDVKEMEKKAFEHIIIVDGNGKVMVSIRDESIDEKPEKIHYCNKCGSIRDLKMCSYCKTIRYCSTQCQQEDWKKHKKKCDKLHNKQFEDNLKVLFEEEDNTAKKARNDFLFEKRKEKRIPKKEMWKNPNNKK
jgi:hypothetical protein